MFVTDILTQNLNLLIFPPSHFHSSKKKFSRKNVDIENKYNLPIVRSLELVMKINPLNNGFWIPC